MLTPSDRQRSFYDADSVCEQLIPAVSFYRKFREIVAPLIDDSMFESMYCVDNGRPPISPSLLAMACVLQFYRNLSDREMERACMYDIEVKFALGLRLDERPFGSGVGTDLIFSGFRDQFLVRSTRYEGANQGGRRENRSWRLFFETRTSKLILGVRE